MTNYIGFYEAKKDPDGGFAVYEYREGGGWTKHGRYNTLAEADQAAAAMAADLATIMAYHPAQAAQDADAQSARVEAATRKALARAGMLAQEEEAPATTENKEVHTMRKHYINSRTGEDTASASQAMRWHRAGDDVQVNTFYNEPHKTGLVNVVHVRAPRVEIDAHEDENRAHCRRIAEELDAHTGGQVYRCPDCGEEIRLPDDVGDKYRCPGCGTVNDVDDLEQLGIYDFLNDVFDIEYRCGSDRELRSVRVMVACGGPNIYLDTASKNVELYWWTERAWYPMSYDAAAELDAWAEELWNI